MNAIAKSLLAVAAMTALARADVRVAPVFTDHMVLQRDTPVRLWGTAAPGEQVRAEISGSRGEVVADAQGKWTLSLPALKASAAPAELVVKGTNTLTLRDVLVGDVWLSGGQSNMQWWLKESDGGAAAIAEAAQHPTIRVFGQNGAASFTPVTDARGRWEVNSPAVAERCSAVAYFFALDIQKKQNVPVGLILTAVGGTPAQAWTSREALLADPTLKHYADERDESERNQPAIRQKFEEWKTQYGNAWQAEVAKWRTEADAAKAAGKQPTPPPQPAVPAPLEPMWFKTPTVLYNGFIAPVQRYTIKGVIWYQGEDNSNPPRAAEEYATLFPAMIADWRQRWGQGDFPFLFVQLANFMGRPPVPMDSGWVRVRDAQRRTLQTSPNTGMAVAIDVGQNNDIHPRNKSAVGRRLALLADRIAYGNTAVVAQGPLYQSMSVESGAIRIRFDDAAGLKATGGKVEGFSIAGEDRKFVWADARIDGQDVVVSSPAVPRPVAVRYAWADDPAANLYNAADLPASPFRTDDWPLVAR